MQLFWDNQPKFTVQLLSFLGYFANIMGKNQSVIVQVIWERGNSKILTTNIIGSAPVLNSRGTPTLKNNGHTFLKVVDQFKE